MIRAAACACLLLAAACGDERVAAPPAPLRDGSTRDVQLIPDPPTGRTDGGQPIDATLDDGGLIVGCEDIAPEDPNTQLTVLDEGAATPFALSRAFIRWGDDCESPVLLVGLTDGSCLPGVGRQLLFAVDRDAIAAEVVEGDFVLRPDPTPLRVTFSRPVSSAPEMREVYGTCSPDVLGTITFESIGSAADSAWIARFSTVELGHCDPARTDAVLLEGSFSLVLRESFESVCP